jgi:hypothetical protein
LLNTEVVVGTYWKLEEAHLTPVGSPTDDRDLVVQLWLGDVFLIDTTIVFLLELVSGLDTARNWTVLVKFSLHFFDSRESVVERNVVLLVVNSPACILASLIDWTWRPCAIFALVDWSA